jgi:hypothetical protein
VSVTRLHCRQAPVATSPCGGEHLGKRSRRPASGDYAATSSVESANGRRRKERGRAHQAPSQQRETRVRTCRAITTKRMKLRYPGSCQDCQVALPAGTVSLYDRGTKRVMCSICAGDASAAAQPTARPEPVAAQTKVTEPGTSAPPIAVDVGDEPAIDSGVAGASTRREHERRKANREARIRTAHPRLGGLVLALSDDPQSTTAWAVGARGEELLAKRLDGLVEQGAITLHDRGIPGTQANIDHIAMAPSGVYVIDAKRYKGRPNLRVEGGLFRARTQRLFVGSRDCTKLGRWYAQVVKPGPDRARGERIARDTVGGDALLRRRGLAADWRFGHD